MSELLLCPLHGLLVPQNDILVPLEVKEATLPPSSMLCVSAPFGTVPGPACTLEPETKADPDSADELSAWLGVLPTDALLVGLSWGRGFWRDWAGRRRQVRDDHHEVLTLGLDELVLVVRVADPEASTVRPGKGKASAMSGDTVRIR